jgi:uncharacterized protein YecE (DUF72 family)
VEINATFYQFPRPEIARMWAHQVSANPAFRFTAKLNRRFTHERMLDAGEAAAFSAGLAPLRDAGRLGCVLMQFPWSFKFTRENREFLIGLRRAFHGFPLTAEMRHSSWASDEALGTFIDYHIGFVNLDQPDHVKAMPPTGFLTSPVGYVRLHGRNAGNWLAEYSSRAPEPAPRNDYLYQPGQLEEWLPRIRRANGFASETYVVFTNDVRAQSVVNALQMKALIEGKLQACPVGLRAAYSDELRAFVERPRQEMLFQMPESAVA